MFKSSNLFLLLFLLASCSVQQRLARPANDLLQTPALSTAHIGLYIHEPATGRTWYDHQGDQYFVPASNTKIPTCYAAMKYLGDSLPGLAFEQADTLLVLHPTGDPTFLHPDFPRQPVLDWLRSTKASIRLDLSGWKAASWGSGWSWSDYDASYMPERSALPLYGNVLRFSGTPADPRVVPHLPGLVLSRAPASDTARGIGGVDRAFHANRFLLRPGSAGVAPSPVPFITENGALAAPLLADTLGRAVVLARPRDLQAAVVRVVRSQPTDSLLKPLMHRSDNFFAEQALLMVSHALLGEMNDARLRDSLLRRDLSDLPQLPRWADGSGLSRYNLFSPRDFVHILEKMQREFGLARMEAIFPTGNEGTLRNYYVRDSGRLFAKTGTLSGVVALSGWMRTRRGRLLFFSALVNNHQGAATPVRRAVEQFLTGIREKY